MQVFGGPRKRTSIGHECFGRELTAQAQHAAFALDTPRSSISPRPREVDGSGYCVVHDTPTSLCLAVHRDAPAYVRLSAVRVLSNKAQRQGAGAIDGDASGHNGPTGVAERNGRRFSCTVRRPPAKGIGLAQPLRVDSSTRTSP